MKKVNVIVVFLLILMMLSPILVWGVNGQVEGPFCLVTIECPGRVNSGDTFKVGIYVDPKGNEVAGVQLELVFNPSILLYVEAQEGVFLKSDRDRTVFNSACESEVLSLIGVITTEGGSVSRPGVFADITFKALEVDGSSRLNLFNCIIAGVEAIPYSVEVISSGVVVTYEMDPDIDGDGVSDSYDNCPKITNPGQLDSDRDGWGDECDICPNDSLNDIDSDGICRDIDNYPNVFNSRQVDTDGDGSGDTCDRVDQSIFSSKFVEEEIVNAVLRALDQFGGEVPESKPTFSRVTMYIEVKVVRLEAGIDGTTPLLGVK